MKSREVITCALISLGFYGVAVESFHTAAQASKLNPNQVISQTDVLTGSNMTAGELKASSELEGVGFLILASAAGAATVTLPLRERQVSNQFNQSNTSKK